MGSPNPPFEWLRELQETLWQIRMVSKDSGIGTLIGDFHDLIAKVRGLSQTFTALGEGISRITRILNSRAIQRGAQNSLNNASVRLSQLGTRLQGRGGFISRRVGGMLRGASQVTGCLGAVAGGLSTTGLVGSGTNFFR